MIAKLIVEGKEFPIEIQDPELEKLLAPPKKTGYERVDTGDEFWCVDYVNDIHIAHEGCNGPSFTENRLYKCANYYSDETVAANNARADMLMRQLRRFAVEHRESELDWRDGRKLKFYIFYYHELSCLMVDGTRSYQHLGVPYFDSKETAQLAANTFQDELIWYFTEYKDGL